MYIIFKKVIEEYVKLILLQENEEKKNVFKQKTICPKLVLSGTLKV